MLHQALVLASLAAHAHAFEAQSLQDDAPTNSTSTGAADGIWTNHDWSDGTVGVNNGEPYGIEADLNRRILSSQVLMGTFPSDDVVNEQANVALVNSLFNEKQFQQAFPLGSPVYAYDDLLRAIAKFPMFCNEAPTNSHVSLTDTCKKELAALLAHIKYETGTLQARAQDGCSDPYQVKSSCNYFDSSAESLIYMPYASQQYYGRGALMITGNVDYGMFSNIAFTGGPYDRLTLVEKPSQVSIDGYLAFASALWIYMTPINPAPSMHEVMAGFYTPSAYDLQAGRKAGFGASTNIISEGSECNGTTETEASTTRQGYYNQFCQLLSIDEGANLTCAGMSYWDANSSTYLSSLYFKPSELENQCERSQTFTGYNMFATRDYMRCVCDYWGQEVDDCLVAVPDTTDGEGGDSSAMQVAAVASTFAALLLFY